MPRRMTITAALSRLGLAGFAPVEPPAGAGTAGGTVDARGFGRQAHRSGHFHSGGDIRCFTMDKTGRVNFLGPPMIHG